MEDNYTLIILVTLVAFLALAAVLLVPVWRFLNREERRSERWDAEQRKRRGGNGQDEK